MCVRQMIGPICVYVKKRKWDRCDSYWLNYKKMLLNINLFVINKKVKSVFEMCKTILIFSSINSVLLRVVANVWGPCRREGWSIGTNEEGKSQRNPC